MLPITVLFFFWKQGYTCYPPRSININGDKKSINHTLQLINIHAR